MRARELGNEKAERTTKRKLKKIKETHKGKSKINGQEKSRSKHKQKGTPQ